MMPLEPRMDLAVLSERLLRLFRLDTTVFDEVRHEPAATVPAIMVVVGASALAGIGGWIWWAVQGFGSGGEIFIESVVMGSIFCVALWIVWLLVAWVMLTQLFREDADWQQMLRTMGLAAAPLALSVLMFIPGVGFGIGLASVALFFGLTTIAIQAVTPANPARVLVANLCGFAVWAIVLGLLATPSSHLAPGIFLVDSATEALSNVIDHAGVDLSDLL